MRPLWLVCSLFTMLVHINAATAQTRTYPQPTSVPLQVGSEDYRESYLTLRRLEGMHVDFSAIKSTSKEQDINIPDSLFKNVREKIEASGLLFLSRDEMLTTPGLPILHLWPTYETKSFCENQQPDSDQAPCDIPDYCTVSLWAEFAQSATILRQPENQYKLSTWGSGDKAHLCEEQGQWMADAVLNQLDNFITDYKKAQRDFGQVVVDNTTDVPSQCSQSWVTHLNVFKSNEARINEDIKPLLSKLRSVAARCNTYSYIIETHADQRADADYNKLLTEARARSIKDFLVSNGMEHHRILMRPLGESAPISNGTSEADHAKNRRVVIIPMEKNDIANAQLELE